MNAQVYVVRHGETDLNSTEQERFRGWGDPPLNADGIRSAHRAGQALANKGIRHIYASDLDRTMHTAHILSQYTGADVTPVRGLRPWHLGDYTGQPVEPNLKAVEAHQKNPDHPLPGGESYNSFLSRWQTTFQQVAHMSAHVHQGPVAVVTHTRNTNALKSAVSGSEPEVKSMIKPGGIVRADIHQGKLSLVDLEAS